jgi:putative transposase
VRESQTQGVAATAKKHGISDHSIYIWRRKYGQMDAPQVSELKRMVQENARLKKMVAERDLEIEVMKDINAKKW